MRSNTIGYSLLLVIQMIYEQVLADFEQHCTYNDYYARRNVVSTCGSHLTAYVMDLCHNQPYLGDYSGYRYQRDIFLTKNDANAYLRVKRGRDSLSQGIVCECCINRCSAHEISQYCDNKRKKRSIKSLITSISDSALPSPPDPEKDLENLYKKIEEDSLHITAPAITDEQYEQMSILERNKEENIRNEHLAQSSIEKVPTSRLSNSYIQTDVAVDRTSGQPVTTQLPHRRRHKHSKRRQRADAT